MRVRAKVRVEDRMSLVDRNILETCQVYMHMNLSQLLQEACFRWWIVKGPSNHHMPHLEAVSGRVRTLASDY